MNKPSLKINSQRGYTLLFAVIVSVLVLSIAAFILSVSRKQAILASSARDSVYAFYAADSGLECAVENLDALATTTDPITNLTSGTIYCGNKEISVTYDPTNSPIDDTRIFSAGTSTYVMSNNTDLAVSQTQSGLASCASTTVTYVYDTPANGAAATSTLVRVMSRGYNIGWDSVAKNCNITGPRKLERALQFTQER